MTPMYIHRDTKVYTGRC